MKKNKTLPKKPSISYDDQPANDQPKKTEQSSNIANEKLLTLKEKKACDQATD